MTQAIDNLLPIFPEPFAGGPSANDTMSVSREADFGRELEQANQDSRHRNEGTHDRDENERSDQVREREENSSREREEDEEDRAAHEETVAEKEQIPATVPGLRQLQSTGTSPQGDGTSRPVQPVSAQARPPSTPAGSLPQNEQGPRGKAEVTDGTESAGNSDGPGRTRSTDRPEANQRAAKPGQNSPGAEPESGSSDGARLTSTAGPSRQVLHGAVPDLRAGRYESGKALDLGKLENLEVTDQKPGEFDSDLEPEQRDEQALRRTLLAGKRTATQQNPAAGAGKTAIVTGGVSPTASAGAAQTGVADLQSVANDAPSLRASAMRATQVAPPANPVPVQAILQQVRMQVRPGVRNLQIYLSPPELGKLRLRFELRGSQLRVTVTASRPEVVTALQNDLSSFSNTLRDAGIDLSSLDIGLESDSDTGQARKGAFANQPADSGGNEPTGQEKEDDQDVTTPNRVHDGAVDFIA